LEADGKFCFRFAIASQLVWPSRDFIVKLMRPRVDRMSWRPSREDSGRKYAPALPQPVASPIYLGRQETKLIWRAGLRHRSQEGPFRNAIGGCTNSPPSGCEPDCRQKPPAWNFRASGK
jgi:hypothetical protein